MSTHRSARQVARALVLVLGCAGVAGTANAQSTPPTPPATPDAPATGAAPASPGSAPDGTTQAPAPATPPAPAPTTEVPPAPGSAEAIADASPPSATELYDAAFDALARGERDLAVSLLRELSRMPDPLAVRARELLAAMPPAAPATSATPLEDEAASASEVAAPGTQRTTSAARAELVFFQTVHGFTLGAETCVMAQCEDARPWVLSLMLGAGAGFGASWVLSRDGVTPGLARATTDGTWWGVVNGGLLLLATDAASYPNDEAVVTGAFLAGGQILGLTLGGLAYAAWEPTAGQASLTASGGIWTLTVTAEFVAMLEPNFDDERPWGWILLTAGNLGVIGGAYFASKVPMTASRVLVIDAGGLLGTLTGMGVSVLVQGSDPQPGPTFGVGLLGTLLGLGLAYHFTADWDGDEDADANSAHFALAPLPGGAQLTFSAPWF